MRAWRHSPFRVNGARRLARRGAHCSLLLSSRMFRSSARTRGPLSPHQHLASLLITASAAGVFPPHQTCSLGPGVDPSLPAPPSVIQPSPQRQPWDGPLPLPSPLMSRLASPHPSLNTAFEVTAFPALSPPAPRRSSRSRWSLEMLFMKPAFHPLPPRGPFPPTGHFLSLGAPAALLAFSTCQHLLPASPGLSDTYASMLPSSHSAAVLGALLGDALAASP